MPGKQLNPQYPAQQQFNSHIITSSRIKKKMEESIPDWRVDQSFQRAQFSKRLQELKQLQFCNRTIQLQE